jgi:hypothetical protein
MARRWPLDLYLSLHDLSLHLFQNVFTLLKGEPDLLGHDSASATFEFCDLFYGEGLTSEAGFNPDDEFHGVSSVAFRATPNTPPYCYK